MWEGEIDTRETFVRNKRLELGGGRGDCQTKALLSEGKRLMHLRASLVQEGLLILTCSTGALLQPFHVGEKG